MPSILNSTSERVQVEALTRRAERLVKESPVHPSDREDAVQELVVAGLWGIARYREGLDAVVQVVMRNKLVDFLRGYRGQREVPAGSSVTTYEPPSSDIADSVVEWDRARREVKKLLSHPALTLRQKELLTVLLYTRMDIEKSAALLDITPKRVRNALSEIRAAVGLPN